MNPFVRPRVGVVCSSSAFTSCLLAWLLCSFFHPPKKDALKKATKPKLVVFLPFLAFARGGGTDQKLTHNNNNNNNKQQHSAFVLSLSYGTDAHLSFTAMHSVLSPALPGTIVGALRWSTKVIDKVPCICSGEGTTAGKLVFGTRFRRSAEYCTKTFKVSPLRHESPLQRVAVGLIGRGVPAFWREDVGPQAPTNTFQIVQVVIRESLSAGYW